MVVFRCGDPRCNIFIVMGKTDPDASRHTQQSMVLVPADSKGVKIERALSVFNYDDAPPWTYAVTLRDVRVPQTNILLEKDEVLRLRRAG